MAVLINGNGNEAIYAQQDADWYAALMGGVTMITAVGEQFAYELLDANTIGVKDGVIITKEGRRLQVDTNVIDTFDIPTGAQGTTNYYIIGYHLVTDEESVQSAETFVQLMDNGTDTIPEGSFKEGDDDVYVSLYRVEQNDLTIGTITLLLPTVSDSMQQQITQISNDLSALSMTPQIISTSAGNTQMSHTCTASEVINVSIISKADNVSDVHAVGALIALTRNGTEYTLAYNNGGTRVSASIIFRAQEGDVVRLFWGTQSSNTNVVKTLVSNVDFS